MASNPKTFRPTAENARRLKLLRKARIKTTDVVNLALEESFKSHPTHEDMLAAVIAKKTAEYYA